MSTHAEPSLIKDSSLGQELEPAECKVLASKMGVTHLSKSELLTSEGGANSTLYLLVGGQLSVLNTINGNENVVYTMKKGECAGTRAFVDRTPRKATLRAVNEATVYTLEPDAFESLLDAHPRIVYKVMRALFRITHANLMRMNHESEQLANYIAKTRGRY